MTHPEYLTSLPTIETHNRDLGDGTSLAEAALQLPPGVRAVEMLADSINALGQKLPATGRDVQLHLFFTAEVGGDQNGTNTYITAAKAAGLEDGTNAVAYELSESFEIVSAARVNLLGALREQDGVATLGLYTPSFPASAQAREEIATPHCDLLEQARRAVEVNGGRRRELSQLIEIGDTAMTAFSGMSDAERKI